MLISPPDHYRLHERVVTTSSETRAFISAVEEVAATEGCDVFWRGQADHRWGITSSLSRVTDSPTALVDADLKAAETDLLKEAKRWVSAPQVQPAHDLEWLALLQHHSIPTRMLDFTPDPLIATFFAAEGLDDIEGRIFAILISQGQNRVSQEAAAGFEIGQVPAGQVRLWEPRAEVSPRLAAQHGVFVLGKLPSTSIARHVWDESLRKKRLMVRSEVVSVMSLPLYFQTIETQTRPGANGTRCFTARLHIDKASLRGQLAKRSRRGGLRPSGEAIDHAYCYPDVDGMSRYSRVLARIRRGVN